MPKYKETISSIAPVGTNMFHLRRKLGITQKELATPEFSISYISAIERGRIHPSLKALEILARRLGVSSAELLTQPHDDLLLSDGQRAGDETEASASLKELLGQRPAPYFAPLTLCWAAISISQRSNQQARELLETLAPDSISAEQRLLRLYLLGHIALTEGRAAEAQSLIEQVFEQPEFSNHAELVERCRFLLACAYEAQEQFLNASDTFLACVQAIEKGITDEPLFVIMVYSALADHHRRLGRHAEAVIWYKRALEQYPYFRSPSAMAEISARLSQRHLANVHSTLADWYAARSRAIYDYAGGREYFTQIAANLGLTYQELGDQQAAEQQLHETIIFSEQMGAYRQGILTRISLADLLLERQEIVEAERLALEARARCLSGVSDQNNAEVLSGRVLVTLADINKARNRVDEAEQCFQEAVELLKKHNATAYLSQAYFRYSALLHQTGRDAESYEMVRQAFLLTQGGSQKHT